jgi:outer membrane lipoprotein-sorting protein
MQKQTIEAGGGVERARSVQRRKRIATWTGRAFLSALLLSAFDASASTPEQKGLEIATKADKAQSGYETELADIELILINAQGDQITRRMTGKVREVDSDGDRSILTFVWPPDVKNTRLLTWAHWTKSDDQWLFLPSIKRVKRLSARGRKASFMGSEFSYEDIAHLEVEKYTYKYIKDDAHSGRPAWVIEAYPVDKKSAYSKQVVWIDKDYLYPIRVDYYDLQSKHRKTAIASDFKKLNNRWWRPAKIEMTNQVTRKRSIFVFKKRTFGADFADDEFEPVALGE